MSRDAFTVIVCTALVVPGWAGASGHAQWGRASEIQEMGGGVPHAYGRMSGLKLPLFLSSAVPSFSGYSLSHARLSLSTSPGLSLHPGSGTEIRRASQLFATHKEAVSVAYAWRNLTVVGSARGKEEAWGAQSDDSLPRRSRKARFSYHLSPRLTLHLSRGTWSSVDQLVNEGEIKRTSVAATYFKRHTGGEWQTTFAWGRSARKGEPSVYGYLAETSVRMAGKHVAFGRLEQAGVDELPGIEFPYSPNPRVNKVSVGYYRDVYQHRGTRLGAGVVASQYLLPQGYKRDVSEPTAFMLFVRVKLQ